ncbi:MAG TPA: hypothetical protein VFX40_04500, partial [Gemmatimonadaceae bacterium]|nr:hypothetical protein [Gemmatimonadaceae bacterium]
KLVRSVGDPEERMREDRLRALRAMRFAARFGFDIEPATWNAILGSSPHLGRLSAERVKQEIEKTMEQVSCPSHAFRMWQSSGAFGTLLPQLADASEVELATVDQIATPPGQGPGQRTPGVPVAKGNRRILRLIALFAAVEPGSVLNTLKGLRFSNADAAWISGIVTLWSSLHAEMRFAMTGDARVADPVLRRWAAMTGRTRLASVMRLAAARWSAERRLDIEAPSAAAVHSAYRRAIRIAYRDPVEVADLAVDGNDLARMGITGPAVGRTLRNLLETVITDPASNTREVLLKAAQAAGAGQD